MTYLKLNNSFHLYLDNSSLDQTVFFGCHNKVMSEILVVDNVLQSDSSLKLKLFEELKIILLGQARNLLDSPLFWTVLVDKVSSDGYGHFGIQTLSLKTYCRLEH